MGVGLTDATIPIRHECAYRLGARLSCGFSFRAISKTGMAWRGLDVCERGYVLVYIVKGHGEYYDANGNKFEIRPGTLYQRFPGVVHSNIFHPDEDFYECFVVLPPQVFELLLASNAISLKRPGLQLGLDHAIYLRFAEVFRDLKRCPENELHLALARMHRFAAELVSMHGEDAFLKKACSILERDLTGRMEMVDVAGEMGMGYSAFRQQFSRKYGKSPGEYRLRRKIEMAQMLLASQDVQVKDVAARMGYPDIYTFSKQFKRHAGMNPSQFIKARRYGLTSG